MPLTRLVSRVVRVFSGQEVHGVIVNWRVADASALATETADSILADTSKLEFDFCLPAASIEDYLAVTAVYKVKGSALDDTTDLKDQITSK